VVFFWCVVWGFHIGGGGGGTNVARTSLPHRPPKPRNQISLKSDGKASQTEKAHDVKTKVSSTSGLEANNEVLSRSRGERTVSVYRRNFGGSYQNHSKLDRAEMTGYCRARNGS